MAMDKICKRMILPKLFVMGFALILVILALQFVRVFEAEAADPDPIYNSANGHYYKAISGAINWFIAKDAAESSTFRDSKGHLATITSQEEEFIKSNFPQALSGKYWLGGFQPPGSSEPDGDWQWVTGESFTYTNWAPGEPNNQGGEDGLQLKNTAGQWNDVARVNAQSGYVVEYEPSCTLNLGLSHESGSLTMTLEMATTVPTKWSTWLFVGAVPIRLWSAPIPIIDPPISSETTSPFPSLGIVGFLTMLTTSDGIACFDFGIVDTGSLSLSEGTVGDLRDLFPKPNLTIP